MSIKTTEKTEHTVERNAPVQPVPAQPAHAPTQAPAVQPAAPVAPPGSPAAPVLP